MKVVIAIELHSDDGKRKELSVQMPCPPMDAEQTDALCDSLAGVMRSVMMQTMGVIAKHGTQDRPKATGQKS